MHWSRYPFLRVAIALAGGIWIYDLIGLHQSTVYFLLLFIPILWAIYFWKFRRNAKQLKHNGLWWIYAFSFVVLGILVAQFNEMKLVPVGDHEIYNNANYYVAKIDSMAVPTSKTVRYEVIVDRIMEAGTWHQTKEKALLYFVGQPKESLNFGDRLLICGGLNFFDRQTNPHAFDYSDYMHRQGFFFAGICKIRSVHSC